MIVTCPGCSAKYRVKDAAIPTGGAKMKCPKCGKLFAAHRIADPDASEVPQPIAFTGAEPEETASAAGVGQEWDAMMQSEGLVMAPRDPFHDAPAAAATPQAASSELPAGGVTHDLQLHDVGAGFDAAVQAPLQPGTSPVEEASDPFRNIDIMAPASQPIAGTSSAEESLFGGGEGDAVVRPAVAQPVVAQPAAAAVPIVPGVAATTATKSSAGIRVREPSGELHEFKYLPPARRWVAEHPEPEGLEVSIAGAPFAKATLTHAFSDLNFERKQELEPGAPSHGEPSEPVQHETFPPLPASSALRAAMPTPTSIGARMALLLALVLFVLSGLYAVWQFELLPLEPHLSRMIVSITGASSPLVVPERDLEQEAEQALDEAAAARDKGALALAIINYRRVLSFRRNSIEVLKQLADCYQALGDRSAVAELRRVAPEVFANPTVIPPDASTN